MTSGFYKLDGELLYAHDAVYGPTFTLLREIHEAYSYPVDGWHWFDSEDDAREFFGLPLREGNILPVGVE
jgi:hypothetical protein